MQGYAQTILQLYGQLRAAGYSDQELAIANRAYDAASDLYAARMQSSRKPLLCHCVGVASILAAHSAQAELVAAGLLHNVYLAGDFGDADRGVLDTRRREIRGLVGAAVEQHIAEFVTLPWRHGDLSGTGEQLAQMDPYPHDFVFHRLADELEHMVDLGLCYRPNGQQRVAEVKAGRTDLMAMADRVGRPDLGAELGRAVDAVASADVTEMLINERKELFGTVVIPRSYRKRWLLQIRRRFNASRRRRKLAVG